MFGTVIAWVKGLSVAGRIAVGTATIGTVGVVSAVSQPVTQQAKVPTDAKVEAKAPVLTTKEVGETESVAFEKKTEEKSSLESGKTELKQAGVNGIRTKTYTVTYTDGKETGRELARDEITTAPVDEIQSIGTYVAPKPSCDSNYSGCVPIVSYDLDCGDIGFSVSVLGYDKHRFDRDNDGYGCESY